MKTETKYNKIVNVSEDGQIQVLEYTFECEGGMKGAVGSSFYPISLKEFKERTKKSEVIQYLLDAGIDKKQANAIYADSKARGTLDEVIFDTSYSSQWDYLRSELKLSEKQAHIFDCCGGGRMFDADFIGNVNPELSENIRKAESE